MARLAQDIADRPLAGPLEAAAPLLRLEILSDRGGVVALRDRLEALCQELCEPNVFYEPWMLLPALNWLGDGESFTFLCLYEPEGGQRLCGFFPLVQDSLHELLPLPGYGLWQHRQCFRSTPLIRQGFAERCWRTVFAWLAALPAHRRLLRIRRLPANGAVGRALQQMLDQTPSLRHFSTLHESAFLRVGKSADDLLRRAMSGKTQGTLRRKLRRLQEGGALAIEELALGAPAGERALSGPVEDFLRLEASGWKGKAGTALAADAHHAAFFRDVVQEAQRRGRLSLLCLRHEGRMIAARSLLLAPPGSFVFKIAFDETLARYSPGLLLEMEELRRLHDPADPRHATIAWSDSCAAPDNGPFYRCWPERETIADWRLTSGRSPHVLAAVLWPGLRAIKARLLRRLGQSQ